MDIGLAYDLKQSVDQRAGQPDDALEEYDSVDTVEAIEAALEARGHTVVPLGGGREFLSRALWDTVDIVFNISEGLGTHRSREAQVPSILEMLDIPYTGSDPQCLAICLDKPLTKRLVAMAGVPTPKWRVVGDHRQLEQMAWDGFRFPAFIKPAHEGSSKGIVQGCRVETQRQAVEMLADRLGRYRQPIMVEEYVEGDEITVGIVGNSAPSFLGVMRVLPRHQTSHFVYSLEVKREWQQMVEYECPARLEAGLMQTIAATSIQVFDVLGCRDVARIDFRVASDGVPYFLEINPLPGLNPISSDLPIMAGKMGWSYEALISSILDAALQRCPQCAPV